MSLYDSLKNKVWIVRNAILRKKNLPTITQIVIGVTIISCSFIMKEMIKNDDRTIGKIAIKASSTAIFSLISGIAIVTSPVWLSLWAAKNTI